MQSHFLGYGIIDASRKRQHPHHHSVTQEMRLHEGKARQVLLTFVVLVDLTLLCYFKYTNFIIGDVVNEMFSTNFSRCV